MSRLARTWQLLRHHKPSQFAWRLYRRVRTRLPMPGVPDVSVSEDLDGFRELNRLKAEAAQPIDLSGDAVTLTFLNQPREFKDGIDWDVPDAPHLWRFHLHYHEFLWSVPPEDRLSVMEDWRRRCPPRRGDAWHPFTVSRRLPVWLATLAAVADPPAELVRSAAHQTAWLRADLERDLGGNHLLENAKALAMAGLFFDRKDWRDEADRLLNRELSRQLLPFGEHYERSPMYHALMLEAMRDAQTCGWPRTGEMHDFGLEPRAMTGHLLRVLHPDGRIPLFADAAFDQTPDEFALIRRDHLFAAASADDLDDPVGARSIGDYWTYRTRRRTFLIFDAGPLAADELPAHAHCDLLGIELSVEGRRWVTDSGVFDYEDSAMRAYCRSTAAHSVPQVEGEEHADMWGKFRVGRRGRVAATDLSDGPRAEATARLPSGATMTRRIDVDGETVRVADSAAGTGGRALLSRLHLHPDVGVDRAGEMTLVLRRGDVTRTLTCDEAVAVETSWYCPEFNVRRERPVLVARSADGEVTWTLSDPVREGV